MRNSYEHMPCSIHISNSFQIPASVECSTCIQIIWVVQHYFNWFCYFWEEMTVCDRMMPEI